DGNSPQLCGLSVHERAIVEESLLSQFDLGRVPAALASYPDQWRSWLCNKRCHDLVDRLVGRLRQGAPQIGIRSVPVCMTLQVSIDTGAECVRPKIRLQHAEDGSRLLIGDFVEQLLDLRGCVGLLVNRTRILQRIKIQSIPG